MSGPALDELQRVFFAAIAGRGPAEAAARLVRGDARGSAESRVALYAGMYFHRILDVLRGDFPSLAAVLGAAGFQALARDYLLACPSFSPSIRDVGARLAAFLDEHPLARARAWLPDLARLEWARVDLFDAADAAPLTVDALRALAPDAFAALPLLPIPAHARVPARFAVDEVWRAVPATTDQLDPIPDPPAGPRPILVWRHDLAVRHRPLDPVEDEALALIAPGATFGAVCERVIARAGEADAPRVAFELLLRWASDGLLAAPGDPV